ncbi:MAG: hypothetical protein R3301_05840 [Saprospiraceae bacterium]|nr:hypothetical protein [Saprospiraceae bacterium]
MNLFKFGSFLLLLGLIGCAEDVDRFTPDERVEEPLVGEIGRFFEAVGTDAFSETFNEHIDWGTRIITQHQTIIDIPAEAFEDDAGNICTGIVEIQVIELRTPGEILLAGIQTTSYDNLLSSAGEFYLSVRQNGQEVNLRPGKQIRWRVNDPDPQERMELWYPVSETDPVTGQVVRTWDDADDDPDTWDNVMITEWEVFQDSTQGGWITGFGYECWSDSLKWINIDLFLDIPEEDRTDVCVDLPAGYGNVNTAVFLVFHDFNGIIHLPGNPETMQFCNYYTQFITVGVPIGAPVSFVVISEQGEDCYHFALSETVIEENHLEMLSPEKLSFEEIKEIIMGL